MKNSISILFEDDLLIAINKPAGLLSIADRYSPDKPNAFSILKSSFPELLVVHRIDKETSGLLVFAKTTDAHKQLNIAFETQNVEKIYYCLTESSPNVNEGIINQPIAHSISQTGKMVIHPKGKSSITYYKVIEQFKNFSLISAAPKTGRTHQIRVHLASIGCPLVCDSLYGLRKEISIFDIKPRAKATDYGEIRPILQRTALHSHILNFKLKDKRYNLVSELPKDIKALIMQLRKWN